MTYAEVLIMATKIKNFAIENDPMYLKYCIVKKKCQKRTSVVNKSNQL